LNSLSAPLGGEGRGEVGESEVYGRYSEFMLSFKARTAARERPHP